MTSCRCYRFTPARHREAPSPLEPPLRLVRDRAIADVAYSPLLDGGTLFATLLDGRALALDEASGAVQWSAQLTDVPINPVQPSPGALVLDQGRLITRVGEELLLLDPGSGEVAARYNVPEVDVLRGVVQDGLLVGHWIDDGWQWHVVGIELDTGEVRWSEDVGWRSSFAAAAGSRICFESAREAVSAVAAATGERLWELPVDGAVRGILAVEDAFAIAVEPGVVKLVDGASGEERWSARIAPENPFNLLYEPDGDLWTYAGVAFARLDPSTGEIRRQGEFGVDADGRDVVMFGSADVGTGHLFGTDNDGTVFAFGKETGELEWTHDLGAPIPVLNPPLAADDRLYVLDAENTLQVFERDR